MGREGFVEGLRDLDHEYAAQGMPAQADMNLRRRLEAPRCRSRRTLWLVPAAALLAVSAGLFWFRAPPTLGGFTVRNRLPDFAATGAEGGRVEVRAGGCTLVDETEQVEVVVGRGASIERESIGARVLRGEATFEVAHRQSRLVPYTVRVSHGEIEVVGTRFTVVQGAAGGAVTLHRGVIRFHSGDGRELNVSPGETLRWPLPPLEFQLPVPTPMQSHSVPQPTARAVQSRLSPPGLVPLEQPTPPVEAPKVQPSTDAVLAQVALLRSRAQYEEAVRVLGDSLNEPLSPATRERLSFELGSILTHRLGDSNRACALWGRHQVEHPGGRYGREIAQATKDLKCTEQP